MTVTERSKAIEAAALTVLRIGHPNAKCEYIADGTCDCGLGDALDALVIAINQRTDGPSTSPISR